MIFDYGIVLNGRVADWEGLGLWLNHSRCLVAADGGLNHLVKLGLRPDILLGDLDSASPESIQEAQNQQVNSILYPPEKDYTDSELAIRWCLVDFRKRVEERENSRGGKTRICLLAAFGSRYDHLLSNQLLCEKFSAEADFILTDGLRCQLILGQNSGTTRTLDLSNFCPLLKAQEKYVFSLLAMSDIVEGLSVQNARYNLSDYDLKRGESLGVSNAFASKKEGEGTRISFAVGCLSVFLMPEE